MTASAFDADGVGLLQVDRLRAVLAGRRSLVTVIECSGRTWQAA
jgi:hypothetical protein